MDKDAEKQELENKLAALRSYLDHPVTREILSDNAEEQEALMHLVFEPPTSVAAVFVREQAIGHIKGLRQGRAIILNSVSEIEQQIKVL